MTKLLVTNRSGQETVLDVEPGPSIMEIVRDAGFDELMALCGGCCACATCHIYVDQGRTESLPPISEDEDDLLESSDYRSETSRLSCQIPFTEALDGLRIRIAPEQ